MAYRIRINTEAAELRIVRSHPVADDAVRAGPKRWRSEYEPARH
jgi:hypothetical protein